MNDGMGFDVEVLAEKTIAMLGVTPGKVIWIWANVYSMDLIEALAFRIRARGAFWLLRLNSEPLLHRIGQDVSQEYLGLVPEHELRWLDDIDAIVELRDHGGNIPGVALERRRAMAAEWIALIDTAAQKNIRRVEVINPTPALAAAYNLPLEDFCSRLLQAINVDYAAVDSRQEQIGRLLDKAREVHVTSAAGTDLRLRVDGRKALLDTDSLPRGEAYIAPIEASALGVAVIDKAFFRGRLVESLRLTFSGGHVSGMAAPDAAGVESFRELLAASSGDKDVIAEFAVGTNPGVTEPIGNIALDEKIGGSVHIAIGMNERLGGRNKSNLHLDLVILKPTVWFDGTLVLENGVFTV
jgi:leucyl aminopeptidase (aminopeptidase T)